ETLPRGSYTETEAQLVSRLLKDVGIDGNRWRDLTGKLGSLIREQHELVAGALRAVAVEALSAQGRGKGWGALGGGISHQREGPDANWALPAHVVDSLEEIYNRFEPQDELDRRAWLFSTSVYLPRPKPLRDVQGRDGALNEASLRAA